MQKPRNYMYAVYRVRIPAFRNTTTGFCPSKEMVGICLRILDKLHTTGINIELINLTDDDSICFEFFDHANIKSKSLYRAIEVFSNGDIVYLSRESSDSNNVKDVSEKELMDILLNKGL